MKEENIHRQVCEYIRYQYPDVIFNTDLSGIRMTLGQAAKVKSLRSSRGFPDLVIYKKVVKNEPIKTPFDTVEYGALFIELKREGEKIFKRCGEPKDEHITEQIAMIAKLNRLGYYATFAIGFDDAKSIIDWYLGS